MKRFQSVLSILSILSLVIASDSSSSHELPSFDQLKDSLTKELQAWKDSPAGHFAKDHGLYVEPKTVKDKDAVLDNQLHRFFTTKLQIEQLQRENPDATFSTDSPFTLMTNDEFATFVGGSFRRGNNTPATVWKAHVSNTTDTDAPAPPLAAEKDWTTTGCVAAVKNQGQCGSCWAFAAVAALESAWCLKGNPLTLLSEQQLTSCESDMGGCQGGYPGDALNYVKDNGGLCTGADYPYTSGNTGENGECTSQQCQIVKIPIQQVVMVPKSEPGLINAINGRPVAVGVAAGNPTWKQYRGGVVTRCSSTQLDHAVLAVGFGGSNTSKPYYKIKNSWGTSWGENGYIRLKRGVGAPGTCGIIGPKSAYPVV